MGYFSLQVEIKISFAIENIISACVKNLIIWDISITR